MSAESTVEKLTVKDFVERCREAMIPLSSKFSYFSATPLTEEEVQEYLTEPIAALPPSLLAVLPGISVILVPHLEKPDGKEKTDVLSEFVGFERPAEGREAYAAEVQRGTDNPARLVFAIKEIPVSEYHYHFYRALARVAAGALGDEREDKFFALLREELGNRVHGEVDQGGWQLKQSLIRRQSNVRRETKLFREYAQQSLVDTLTLYLHGICCDIDVETGPRQLPSRFLRTRLELLESLFPPPEGFAVFPEEIRGE